MRIEKQVVVESVRIHLSFENAKALATVLGNSSHNDRRDKMGLSDDASKAIAELYSNLCDELNNGHVL